MKKITLWFLLLIAVMSSNVAMAGVTYDDLSALSDIVDGIDTDSIYLALTAVFTLSAGVKALMMGAHYVLAALGRK